MNPSFKISDFPSVTEKFIIVEDTGDDDDNNNNNNNNNNNRFSIASSRIDGYSYMIQQPQMTKRRTFDNRSILSEKEFFSNSINEKYNYNNRFNSPAETFVGSIELKKFESMSQSSSSSRSTLYNSTISQPIFYSSDYDLDPLSSNSAIVDEYEANQLIQGLRPHNVAFITLCSVFGTGFFLTSSTILENSGPLSLFLGFLFTGILAFQVLTALSDMSSYIPLPDNLSGFANRFVDPALGFSTGYAFLLTFLLFVPNQISAATSTMSYWIDPETITPAVWILVFILAVAMVNYCKITKYAYLVDSFIVIKLTIYFILAATLACLIFGGGPKHDRLGFRYWKDPGPMATYGEMKGLGGRVVGLLVSTIKSSWSYVGIESFSVAAIETINPRLTIPKAKNILFKLLFPTYLIMAFLIGLCVAYNDPNLILSQKLGSDDPKSSVISIALYNASIGVMGNFVNASLLIFIFSAANTGFYLSTRILYGLSASEIAPKCFIKTTKSGVPIYSFLFVLAFSFISFISVRQESVQTYHYFVDATSVFSLINWACILLTHIRFLGAFKRQNLVHEFKTYVPRSTTSIIPSSIALSGVLFIIFGNNITVYIDSAETRSFNVGEFIAGMIAIPIFIGLYLGFKIYYQTSFVDLGEADLYFYRDIVDAKERVYLQQKMNNGQQYSSMNFFQRLRNKICIYSVQ